jgi:hypothetical protein
MKWIDHLDKKFGRYGVPNVTVILIAGQVVAYVAGYAPPEAGGDGLVERLALAPSLVLAGEWWRVLTFLFVPPATNPLFAFFGWYLFYLMGSTLESQWGAFRYNLYLLLGYLASVVMAFVTFFSAGGLGPGLGAATASNLFLYGTVFLAFARLYPDFTLSIMFILPVKVRWLALLTWLGYGATFLFSRDWLDQAMVVAAVFNYLVFFGRDILNDMRHRHRRMQFQARALPAKGNGPRGRKLTHTCRVCGRSSADEPRTQFRYCSECGGDYCYCPEHLGDHEHVKELAPDAEQERAK